MTKSENSQLASLDQIIIEPNRLGCKVDSRIAFRNKNSVGARPNNPWFGELHADSLEGMGEVQAVFYREPV